MRSTLTMLVAVALCGCAASSDGAPPGPEARPADGDGGVGEPTGVVETPTDGAGADGALYGDGADGASDAAGGGGDDATASADASSAAYPSPWSATGGTILINAGAATTAVINDRVRAAAGGARPFHPTVPATGAAAGLGPSAAQAVVRIVYAAGQGDFTRANSIVLTGSIRLLSNVRLEIDSGVRLARAGGWTASGALVDLSGATNVTLTAGDRSHGGTVSMAGRSLAGRFLLDTSAAPRASRWQGIVLSNGTGAFLVERFHTKQSMVTNTAAVVARSYAAPHDGVYQHHSNSSSPFGYGPNQLVSLRRAYIFDIWTEGGTALRFETDGNAAGVHSIVAERLVARSGSRAISLTPHCQQNDHVTIRDIRAESPYYGVTLGGTPSGSLPACRTNRGRFLTTVIEDACFVAGHTAQAPVGVGSFDPAPDPVDSNKAVDDRSPTNDDITLRRVYYSQAITRFTAGPGPGTTTDPSCAP